MEPGAAEPFAVNPTTHEKKGENHADSSVAIGNTNPTDHPDHAAASLRDLVLTANNNHPQHTIHTETEMKSKYLAAALLGTALLTGAAFAQNATTDRSNVNTAVHKEGQWRSSKLIGVNVYNDNNEKIGDINELIIDKSGKVDDVVLGVGGFLGMGERDVAVKFSDLKWSNEPVRGSSASGNTTTRPATTGAGSNATAANAPKTYPDHAVFNASKDQLKAMPQFDYNK
jgi:sporulation protein YlmC with PRC-barrel domain